MTLSRIETQLASLAASLPRTDPALQTLLRVTDLPIASVGVQITVMVGGFLIRGNVMGTRSFAEQLDAHLESGTTKALERYGADDPRGMVAQEWQRALSGNFAKQLDDIEAADQRHQEAMEQLASDRDVSLDDLKFDDLPDELALSEIHRFAYRSVLTLEHAELLAPPNWDQGAIGTLRVQMSQIGAWWMGMGLPQTGFSGLFS